MNPDVDVAIIGAGLAGLSAADHLVAAGVRAVVLEANDRVGGRVFSHHFDNGQWCERGAEFIDGGHSHVHMLAARLGLHLTRRDARANHAATLVDAAGRCTPMNLHASLVSDAQRWQHAFDALADREDDASLDDASLAELLASIGPLSAIGRMVIGREIRTEFMLPPDQISQRGAARVAAGQRGHQRELHRVVGGNDQLATGLADLLGSVVRLRTPVRHIDSAGVVTLSDGSAMTAAVVIAAVPLPVLSRLWPAMPTSLSAIDYGVGGKISIQYQRRSWRDDGFNGTVLSDRTWGHLWETTDDQPGDTGVLTNLVSSHDGAAFVALPESVDHVVAEIERVLPGSKGLAGANVRTDWTNDRLALGCYSCPGDGQMRAAAGDLGAWHGRLIVAGEHTDRFAGFMEGALRSGTAAALQAIERLAQIGDEIVT